MVCEEAYVEVRDYPAHLDTPLTTTYLRLLYFIGDSKYYLLSF